MTLIEMRGLKAPYVLHELLGYGVTAQVWRVERPDGVFALKRMYRPAGAVEYVRHMMQVEIAVLQQLQHPCIPRFEEAFTIEGYPALVMEYIPGKTLFRRVFRGSPLTERAARDLGIQLCAVLDYVHRQGYVYGDLNPENVIILPTGALKLIDYGTCTRLGVPFLYQRAASPYRAPECGDGSADARGDVYALGATLWAALAGKDPPRQPLPITPLRAVLACAMAVAPGERYRNCQDFQRALEQVL